LGRRLDKAGPLPTATLLAVEGLFSGTPSYHLTVGFITILTCVDLT